jgi:hypothetical protein
MEKNKETENVEETEEEQISEDSLELEEIVAFEWQQQQNPNLGETVMNKEG